MAEIINLDSVELWEALKKNTTSTGELLIFKYSPVCPISSIVEDDLNTWLSDLPESYNLKLAKLDVVASKEVSTKVAEDLSIKHESPQAIWLTVDFKVRWCGSHYDINKNKLKTVLNKVNS
jgi:bacillithiol system protein YtxJ